MNWFSKYAGLWFGEWFGPQVAEEGAAYATPGGLLATFTLGNITATGAATVAVSGLRGTFRIRSVSTGEAVVEAEDSGLYYELPPLRKKLAGVATPEGLLAIFGVRPVIARGVQRIRPRVAGVAAPAGLSAYGFTGKARAFGEIHIPGTAAVWGFRARAMVRSPLLTAAASVRPVGLWSPATIQPVSAGGGARRAVWGYLPTARLGAVTVEAPGEARATSLPASATVRTAAAAGTATATPTGLRVESRLGIVYSTGEIHEPGQAVPYGARAAIALRHVVVSASSSVDATGLRAVGAIGTADAIGEDELSDLIVILEMIA